MVGKEREGLVIVGSERGKAAGGLSGLDGR